MRKTLLAAAIAGVLSVPTLASAEDSPHSFSGNVGLFSQYVFRGLSQTNEDPAIQGGFDYSHASGFYVGTWASNISWLKDSGAYDSSSMEWDFYGGYRGGFAADFSYDVGVLHYYYPGDKAAGFTDADTTEVYAALGWKWMSAKYSYSVDDTFGVANSDGTWYLDLSANVPLTEALTLNLHWGKQEFDGSTAGVDNDSFASYEDWKIGLSYGFGDGFTVGAYYTDTDMTSAQTAFYTINGKEVGDSQFVGFIQKTF